MLRLILANLGRRKSRTILTLLSIITAYLLFGLLQSVNQIFSGAADFVGASRLVTQARVSFTQPLPLRMRPQIVTLPGVEATMHSQWFGGIYQEPKNFFAQFAVDAENLAKVYPEWIIDEQSRTAFINGRAVMLVGAELAKRFGWKVGDRVQLNSTIWTNRAGNSNWDFEVVGIFNGKDEEWQRRTGFAYLNYDYFDEERSFARGTVGTFISRLTDSDRAEDIAAQIDQMTENSPDETKTQSERDFQLGFLKQIGDIGQIVRWILFAVFFTLLLVVGNTMAQSVRERVPELAILKTLGFTDIQVMWLVLAESSLLVGIGAAVGLGLAYLIGGLANEANVYPPFQIEVLLFGAVVAFVMAIVVGLFPALRAMRLRIVDALAGR